MEPVTTCRDSNKENSFRIQAVGRRPMAMFSLDMGIGDSYRNRREHFIEEWEKFEMVEIFK